MSFPTAHALAKELDKEVKLLQSIRSQLELEVVLKSETLARLEAQREVKPPVPMPKLVLGLGTRPALKPTVTRIAGPAFPEIQGESSECSEIMPHLFLGGNLVARDLNLLKHNSITRVLNVASGVIPNYFSGELQYTSFELIDAPREEIDHFILHAIAEIEDCISSGENILVHCHQGISRSATLVIAYVAWKLDLDVASALGYVKARRSIVSPNQGFLNQLAKFETRRRKPRDLFSIHHLTVHSEHESTLVLKQVFGQDVLGKFPRDVFLAVNQDSLMVRDPGNNPELIQTALKLAGWMTQFEVAYCNVHISLVSTGNEAFDEAVRQLPLVTPVVLKEVIEHILPNNS
ncbi:hypothetical protein BASA81_012822 [Batrachochytrium salamandrivorans]|nr:hypothetical protein BASA81_012822 [Batrachochytrium salamandrivorans]